MTTKPLLELTTETQTKTVVVNGTHYELLPVDRFRMRELRQFTRVAEQMTVFYNGGQDMSDDMLDLFDNLLDTSIPMMLPDLPENLRHNMTLLQRMEIANVFLVESGMIARKSSIVQEPSKTKNTRGKASSQALSDSTAEA